VFIRQRIHNYFFGKALDKVAPGGLVAFITSQGTLDSRDNTKVREYLGSRADFLGAIRLPNTAFLANANTQVTTDIIFLRKRHAGAEVQHVAPWFETRSVQLPNNDDVMIEQFVNEYMLDHKEMALGEHTSKGKLRKGDSYTLMPTGDLATQLDEAIARLPQDAINLDPPAKGLDAFTSTQPPLGTRAFEFLIHEGKLAQVSADGVVTVVEDMSQADEARIRSMLPLRVALRDVYDLMADPEATEAQITEAQAELRKAYDKFVKKHGFISLEPNWDAFREDPDLALMLSLENYDEERDKVQEADIFTKRTLPAERRARTADTPGQALTISLGELGRIDLPRIGELLNKGPESAADALAAEGLIIDTPSGWELPALYLSGNVRVKLVEAEAAAALDRLARRRAPKASRRPASASDRCADGRVVGARRDDAGIHRATRGRVTGRPQVEADLQHHRSKVAHRGPPGTPSAHVRDAGRRFEDDATGSAQRQAADDQVHRQGPAEAHVCEP
jgi:hypothetical protein